MKKYLPIALVIIAILFVIGLVLVVRGRGGSDPMDEDENVAEVPVGQRPFTTLTPRSDGHWLDLYIENINVQGAATIEYEFTYTTTDGRAQGTGGTKQFNPGDNFESEILIGTTSSGNFYYDEGVESGELALKFRDENGKLVGRLDTPWNMRYEPESVEFESLSYMPEDSEEIYLVTMNTFGLPENAPENISSGPFGVFASDDVEGVFELTGGMAYHWDGSEWSSVDSGATVSPGVFVTTSQ